MIFSNQQANGYVSFLERINASENAELIKFDLSTNMRSFQKEDTLDQALLHVIHHLQSAKSDNWNKIRLGLASRFSDHRGIRRILMNEQLCIFLMNFFKFQFNEKRIKALGPTFWERSYDVYAPVCLLEFIRKTITNFA